MYCVSQTVLAGREYSGRGGQRVYTHMFLVPDELLQRFGNSPFRVMEALVVSGRLTVLRRSACPTRAASIWSAERRWSMRPIWNTWSRRSGPTQAGIAGLRRAENDPCWVSARRVSGKRLFSALLDLLPPPDRLDFLAHHRAQGLGARDYRLAILPHDREEHRRAIRQVRLEVLDLTNDAPAKFAPQQRMAAVGPSVAASAAVCRRWPTSSRQPRDSCEQDFDLLAEQQRENVWRRMPSKRQCSRRFLHEIAELLEQIAAVVRARRCFRVVLDAECLASAVPQPGNRLVIQIAVRHFQVCGQRFVFHRKTVVLGRDLDAAGLQIQNRLIGASVTELQLECLGTTGQCQQLVPQTDSENRDSCPINSEIVRIA